MDRILVNGSAELRVTFYVSAVATDPAPDTATVTITHGDGTALATNVAATPVPASLTVPAGTFSYSLAAVSNARLDRLTVAWTSALGTVPTIVEVAGGFLVSSATMLGLYPDELQAVRDARRIDIEQRLEGACGVAFVPRYERENVTVLRRGRARLKWGAIRKIRSATVRGVAYSAEQIAALDVNFAQGQVWGLPPSRLHGDVTLEYEHGADFLAADARMAAYDALVETFGPDKVDGRVILKQVDRVAVQYAAGKTATQEFVTPSVMRFIEGNMRAMVA